MSDPSASIEDILPLLEIQQGILAHSLSEHGRNTYVVQAHFVINGQFDVKRWREAWQALTHRHAPLRSQMIWKGVREPVCVVRKPGTITADLRYISPDLDSHGDFWKHLGDIAARDFNEGFDVAKAPLMRSTVVAQSEQCQHWIWTHHHIILDGWSLPLLLREALELYRDSATVSSINTSSRWRDYVAWRRSLSRSDAQRYWSRGLRGVQTSTPLPRRVRNKTDEAIECSSPKAKRQDDSKESGKEAGQQSFAQVEDCLDPAQSEALRTFATSCGVTLNTVAQAVWSLVLRSYCGKSDLVFGATVSGRTGNFSQLESLVGVCIDTIPRRVKIVAEQKIQSWLQQLMSEAWQDQSQAPIGLNEIRAQAPDWHRQEGHDVNPLFESILVYENYPLGEALKAEGLGFSLKLQSGSAKDSITNRVERNNFPLTWVVDPSEGLAWILTYSRAEFQENEIRELSARIHRICFALANSRPEDRVHSLLNLGSIKAGRPKPGHDWAEHRFGPWMPSARGTFGALRGDEGLFEVEQVRDSGATQKADLVGPFAWLCHTARQNPDKIALVASGRQWSYSQLLRRVYGWAGCLRELGAGSRIAICLDRGSDLYCAILAIAAVRGCYVALDPLWPQARRDAILKDAQVSALISDSSHTSVNELNRASILHWSPEELDQQQEIWTHRIDPSPLDPAYIMYTSGTSGRPKGVMISQRALCSYCNSLVEDLALDASMAFAFVSSEATDLGHTSVFGALRSGGTLHWIERSIAQQADRYLQYVERHTIDVLKITPSQLSVLLDGPKPHAVIPRRRLICGGEALSPRLARQVQALAPAEGFSLWNHYGPTEATVGAVVYRVDTAASSLIPIGVPLRHVEVALIDELGEGGVDVGELCLAGASLAEGYIGQARETALRFEPDPNASLPGARRYRTGDKVRRLADGVLDFGGRVDGQLSIRGFRVEVQEIESALRQAPGVSQAGVVGVPAPNGRTQLVGCVVARAPEDFDSESWSQSLRDLLPEAMVPTRWVGFEDLPLLGNGKLDRKALREQASARLDHEAVTSAEGNAKEPSLAPQNALQEMLLAIWKEVLERENLSIRDNLFALGGDSIATLRIAGRLRQRGYSVEIPDLFSYPTVESLALHLGEKATSEDTGAAASLEEGLDKAPLTPIQHWFFAQGHPKPEHFWLSLALRIDAADSDLEAKTPPKLTREKLEHAAHSLARRHPVLGAKITAEGMQRGEEPLGLEVMDLRGRGAVSSKELQAIYQSFQSQLDPKVGRVCALLWLQLDPEQGDRLLLAAHHLAVDVVSLLVMVQELQSMLGEEPLSEKTTSYFSYAHELCTKGASRFGSAAERRHWQWSVAPLREAMPRLCYRESRVEKRVLPRSVAQPLIEKLQSGGPLMLDAALLSVFAQQLRIYSGQSSVVIECEGHGRDDLQHSQSVGWMTSRYPLRLEAPPSSAPAENGSDASAASAIAGLQALRNDLRAVPQGGIGYGYLRYVDQDPQSDALRSAPQPWVSFNHLGNLSRWSKDEQKEVSPSAWITRAPEEVGDLRALENYRAQALEMTSYLEQGNWHLELRYSEGVLALGVGPDDVGAFMDGVKRGLCELSQALDTVKLPWRERFSLAELQSDDEVRAILSAQEGETEDIFPCTPTQAGLYFESIREPRASDMYWNQSQWLMRDISVERIHRAFSSLQARHALLRASVQVDPRGRPLLVVARCSALNFELIELDADPAVADSQWESVIAKDRAAIIEAFVSANPAPKLWGIKVGRQRDGGLRVLWSRHHLLLDGWSSSRLLGELSGLLRGSDGPDRAELKVTPYREYVAWLARQDKAQSRKFWQERLRGVTPCLELPFADRKTAPHERRGSRSLVSQTLGEDLSQRLHSFAQAGQVTANTVGLGVLCLWLSRVLGREEVVVGVTDSGRFIDVPGAESMVGLLMQTSPLWRQVRSSDRLSQFLQHLQRDQATMRAHASLGLAEVQRCAQRPGQALFSVLWVYENYPVSESLQQALGALAQDYQSQEQTHYPLVFVLEPGRELRVSVQYDPEVYSEQGARNVLSSYRSLLEAVVDSETSALGAQLRLSPKTAPRDRPRARQRIDAEDSLARRFFATAARFPKREALSDGYGQRWSYAKLSRRVFAVAQELRARGVGPEIPVGLTMQSDAELIVAMLAILSAGGYYLPLDPTLPVARRAMMAQDAGLRYLLYGEGLECAPLESPDLVSWSLSCLSSEVDDICGAVSPRLNELPAVASNLAYQLFTSGSSGRPKGVGVEHRNVLSLIDATQELLGWDECDSWSMLHRYAFDFSVWEIFGALLTGAKVVIVPEEERREPVALVQRLHQEGVSMLSLTPSAMLGISGTLLDCEALRSHLRYIVFGGEGLDVRRLDASWFEHDRRGPDLINMYGITETTVHVTAKVVRPNAPLVGSDIGRALSHLGLEVLDRDGNELPAGVPGEFFVHGEGVSRGYLGQAALTAQRFLPDPKGPAGSRRYRSGDRGRYLQDTWLHEGRIDSQVQVRGHRIEVEEIAACFRKHPMVEEAYVFPNSQHSLLWAYVRKKAGESPSEQSLLDYLKAWLPAYMIPRGVLFVEHFALTANGKLDRSQLPQPRSQRISQQQSPQTAVQRRMAEMWRGILEVDTVNLDDDFFALGGHSLHAMQLVAALQKEWALELPLNHLFATSKLKDLSQWVESQRESGGADSSLRIQKRRRSKTIPGPGPGPALSSALQPVDEVSTQSEGDAGNKGN